MRTFEYYAPLSLAEAIQLLSERGASARPLAGGTDLVVQMKEAVTRFPHPGSLVSLNRIPELQGIEHDEREGLRIGAGVTMADIAASPVIRERYGALAEGARVVGSFQTMNMATLGGNLCNAAPSADTSPALLVCEAQAVIAGPQGRRSQPLAEFFTGPGKTSLAADEILAEVRIPAPAAHTGSAYQRHAPRKQMDIAVVGVAALFTLGDGNRIERARVALGAVAPTPIRASHAESMLEGQTASEELFSRAAEAAAQACTPISDTRGSADFRRHLVRVMTGRVLATAAERAKESA